VYNSKLLPIVGLLSRGWWFFHVQDTALGSLP
jgi:hypothetical protein